MKAIIMFKYIYAKNKKDMLGPIIFISISEIFLSTESGYNIDNWAKAQTNYKQDKDNNVLGHNPAHTNTLDTRKERNKHQPALTTYMEIDKGTTTTLLIPNWNPKKENEETSPP